MARGKMRAAGIAALLVVVAAAACGVLDFDVTLSQQTFTLDFGQQSGTVPTVACSDAPDICGGELAGVGVDASSMTGVPSGVEVQVGCDDSSGQCFAQASARAAQTVGVLQGDDLGDKI